MNKIDHIDKMMDILKDETKFKYLDGVTEHVCTPQVEGQIVKRLLQLLKRGELSKEVYDRIKPVGAQRPRMYDLPKIHKENIPLRPILSMVRSAQHELAKW